MHLSQLSCRMLFVLFVIQVMSGLFGQILGKGELENASDTPLPGRLKLARARGGAGA
jgi:hypothetical protein